VVFDLDGTLVDSAPDLHVAANRLLAEEGLPPLDLAAIGRMVGEGVPRLVERIFAAVDMPLSEPATARYTDRFRAIYLEAPCRLTRPMPEARACLEALAAVGHPLAVCTNKPIAPTEIILRDLDLADFFGAVVGGDSLAVRKPDPAPLRLALDRVGGDGAALFVGDSETDLKTARAATVPIALVEGGYTRTPVRDLPADHHLAHLGEVTTLLGI
jgi:phosphoglycolate phosphatase